jgi:hypothetical protein
VVAWRKQMFFDMGDGNILGKGYACGYNKNTCMFTVKED